MEFQILYNKDNGYMKKRLISEIRDCVKQSQSNIFIIADFIEIGNRKQISRVLNNMARNNELIKIGYGVFAKTQVSKINGKVIPISGLRALTEELFKKLNIEFCLSSGDIEYRAGRTTQIPTGLMIGVKKKITRKISYNGNCMKYEIMD